VTAVGVNKLNSTVLHGARIVVVIGLEAAIVLESIGLEAVGLEVIGLEVVSLIAHRLVAGVRILWEKLALGILLVYILLVIAVSKQVAWLLAVEAEAVLNAQLPCIYTRRRSCSVLVR
jgi:hypothetical protein